MNWRNYVEKQNEKSYVLPEGWDSREVVAKQLDCSPDRVDDNLRPGLNSGEIQKKQFKVWQPSTKRVVWVTAYSKAQGQATDVPSTEWTPESEEKARALKKAGKSWAEIGKAVGKSRGAVKNKFERENW